jgi:Domain of unknown function (DUF4145)
MAELNLDCPWCRTKNCAFTSEGSYLAETVQRQHPRFGAGRYQQWFALLRCRRCGHGVLARLEVSDRNAGDDPHQLAGDPIATGSWYLRDWFPSQPISDPCPDHAPEAVAQFFNEARDSLDAERWNAAGAMYRKAIDVATKDLVRKHWPQNETEKGIKEDLIVRIERLHARGRLTDALRDWAHQVRIGGKDAAHDEDPFTSGEAETLHQFTRLFLTYTYTMPEEVRLRRAQPDKQNT